MAPGHRAGATRAPSAAGVMDWTRTTSLKSGIRAHVAQDDPRHLRCGPGPGQISCMAFDAPTASRRAFLTALGLVGPVLWSPAVRAQQVSVRSGSLGTLLRTVTLGSVLDHPQGITASADGATWFVTSVLRKEQKGLLVSFRAADGGQVQRVEVQDGPRYHPGGLGRLGDTLW